MDKPAKRIYLCLAHMSEEGELQEESNVSFFHIANSDKLVNE